MYQVIFVYGPDIENKINSKLKGELRNKKIVNISLSSSSGITTSEQIAAILYEEKDSDSVSE